MKPQGIPTPYQDLTCVVMVKKIPKVHVKSTNYGGKVEYALTLTSLLICGGYIIWTTNPCRYFWIRKQLI